MHHGPFSIHIEGTDEIVADLSEGITPSIDFYLNSNHYRERVGTVYFGAVLPPENSLAIVRAFMAELDKLEAELVRRDNAPPATAVPIASVEDPVDAEPTQSTIVPRSSAAINTNLPRSRVDQAHSAASRERYGRG